MLYKDGQPRVRCITNRLMAGLSGGYWYSGAMARPYTDPVEIITEPIPAQTPIIPADAKIVVGAVAPASPEPIPILLLPGFEYRLREWRDPETHVVHWLLERRRAAQYGESQE